MKFTDGMWTPLAGYKIHTAQYLWKYTVEQDAIHAFVVCHPIQSGDDLTRGPALEFTFRAVGPEMCEVCMTHFKGSVQNAPAFHLNRQQTPVEIEEQEETVVMKNGRLTLTVYKGDSSIIRSALMASRLPPVSRARLLILRTRIMRASCIMMSTAARRCVPIWQTGICANVWICQSAS